MLRQDKFFFFFFFFLFFFILIIRDWSWFVFEKVLRGPFAEKDKLWSQKLTIMVRREASIWAVGMGQWSSTEWYFRSYGLQERNATDHLTLSLSLESSCEYLAERRKFELKKLRSRWKLQRPPLYFEPNFSLFQ